MTKHHGDVLLCVTFCSSCSNGIVRYHVSSAKQSGMRTAKEQSKLSSSKNNQGRADRRLISDRRARDFAFCYHHHLTLEALFISRPQRIPTSDQPLIFSSLLPRHVTIKGLRLPRTRNVAIHIQATITNFRARTRAPVPNADYNTNNTSERRTRRSLRASATGRSRPKV
jgi:hypothetical protein